ncbi:MAG: efflux RND transporter permease subunit, partial [Gemmatimonadaceae bacterium]
MSLPRRSIRRPVAVVMLFVAVAMLGGISLSRLPIDLLPDIAYPKLVVHTGYPGVAPQEVERFITEPIERVVSAVPGVERVESVSREGVSLVTLRFAWGTDMDFSTLNVRERLDNLRGGLPELAERPTLLRTDPGSEPIMAVTVAGRGDLWALKDLAESVIKRRFEQIDGIAQAAVTGGLEREIQVEIEPRLLESFWLTIADVAQALEAANQSAPGGTVLRGRSRYSLRTLGEFQTVEQIGDVVVVRGSGERTAGAGGGRDSSASLAAGVRLRDIARITDGFKERESIARYNGREAVGLLLFKESGANTVRVSERVEEVLAQLRAQYPDVALDVATSQAGFIADAISNVVQQVLIGGILAFLVLFLFLRDARYPVAIALAIPISIVATFALFDLAGVSLNIMTLGGLALGVGMLMDNSIVVVENIFRRREMGVPASEAAASGAEEVQRAIVASTLTTIAVFGPIIYVEGVAGRLFGSLSLAVAFSLSASVLVALTLLPMLAARWATHSAEKVSRAARRPSPLHRMRAAAGRLTARPLNAFDRAFARFAAWYDRVLISALEHRGRVVALALLMLAVTVGVALTLERSVLPEVEQGQFRIRLELARGTPLDQTAEDAGRLESILRADSAVGAVFARIGREEAIGSVSEEESGLNTAILDVRLRSSRSTSHVLERLRPRLAEFLPGSVTLETGQATALGTLLGGGEADLVVRVRGENLEGATEYARAVEHRLRAMPSLANVRLGSAGGHPELRVVIDRERAASYGIEPRLIAQTVEAYMRGTVATEFVAFDRKVPIVVRLPESTRRSADALRLLRVNGIPLRELVSVEEAMGPAEVRRIDQGRVVPVYADVTAGDLDAATASLRDALAALEPPPGVRADVGGESEEMARSFAALAFAFVIALLLVYMILAAEFESLLHPF